VNTNASFSPPPALVERVVSRRGRLHAFEHLNPTQTALLVIDMQNSFVQEGVGHAWVPAAAGICPAINRTAHTLRELGGQVVWVLNTFTEESLESWSHFHQELWHSAGIQRRNSSMAEGQFGHALYPDLNPVATDLRIQKLRYSAFIQGSSSLHDELQTRGINTLLIAGTATEVCCESTARDAMMLNYRTVMLSDGCASLTSEAHAAALSNFLLTFGDVQSCDEAIGRLTETATSTRGA
jgi:ureidoacrylate peracid hydrolase